jgi:hypothetical protein
MLLPLDRPQPGFIQAAVVRSRAGAIYGDAPDALAGTIQRLQPA